MSNHFEQFEQIRQTMIDAHDEVQSGKMMSSEAITYKGKVFAFFGRAEVMCFKLGRDCDTEALGITDYRHLAPFKTKPPMRDWFLVDDHQMWQSLADHALQQMKQQLD